MLFYLESGGEREMLASLKCFTFFRAVQAALTSILNPSLWSALGCHAASLTWLLQEQIESCYFHVYCLKLGCSDEVGREYQGRKKQKRERAGKRALKPILLVVFLQIWKFLQFC